MNIQNRLSLINEIAGNIKLCLSALVKEQKKDCVSMTENSDKYAPLYLQLIEMIDKGQICEAEDRMYEQRPDLEAEYDVMMLKVYEHINGLGDDFLKQSNFPREEINIAVDDIMKQYFG